MPQGTKKSFSKPSLGDKKNKSPKAQRKTTLVHATKKSNLHASQKAKKDLSKMIHKNIEQQMIAKCQADKPGILHIVKPQTIKTREKIDQRKAMEKKMRAAGATEIRR